MKNIKIKITKESLLVGMILLLGAFIPVFLMSKNSPLYPFNDWYDINQYFSVGKGMLFGKVPYVDLVDQKGPFLYFIASVAYLISHTDFLGWFILEIIDLFVFSYFSLKTLRLYFPENRYLVCAVPFVCCILTSSSAFQHGGSAEEMSIWIISAALYSMLKMIRSGDVPSASLVLANGILFGLLFWTKFTMTGIYIVWVIWLCFFVKKRTIKHILMFIVGYVCATLPWIIYFGFHHAMKDWLYEYFFRNIFSYGQKESLGIAQLLISIFRLLKDFLFRRSNLPILMLLTLACIFCLLPHKRIKVSMSERICIVLMMIMTTMGVYAGGFDYGYYGLILIAYTVLGFLPLIDAAEHAADRFGKKLSVVLRNLIVIIPVLVVYLGFTVFSFKHCDNRYMLDMKKEALPQYVFADIIKHSPEDERVLLNYAFLDAGVYTVLDQVPQMKYFVSINSDYDRVIEIQNVYIESGIPDYVLTFYPVAGTEEQISDVPVLKDDYHVVSYVYHYIEGGERTYVLWARNK